MSKSMSSIPLVVKIAYSAFVAVLVPVYWIDYGPTNFLYFCDVALLLTVAALWAESALVASIALVGILIPQLLWMVDFIFEALGLTLTGMTGYMFNRGIPLFTRCLSFFHFWLPLFLLWLVKRLGYDRRAVSWCVGGGWALIWACYLWTSPPPPPPDDPNLPVSINYVYGFSRREPQSWLPQPAYMLLLTAVLPLGLYLPAHLLLARLFAKPPSA